MSKTIAPVNIVWFKRDLRVEDHGPLTEASEHGAVLPLFVVEPELWRQSDMSARQWEFVREALNDLRAELAARGQPLIIRIGRVVDVLDEISDLYPIASLWSHQETGNRWTFDRDIEVAAWCRLRGVPWHEQRQDGVVRRLTTRNGWAARWDREMAEPLARAPTLAPLPEMVPGDIPRSRDLGLAPDPCPARQTGGRKAALIHLESFLGWRGEPYRTAMSSPLTAETACSRLSAHLAWGTLSLRETAQATWSRQRMLKRMTAPTTRWRGALTSFNARLHWRGHFIQKLEDAPSIETRNLHPAYDGLRPSDGCRAHLEAWQSAETGFPFVDACMRFLRAQGWLPFRARAMLMAFASYHLWIDWRRPGEHLARLFVDYEPGIHWPQVQMQSGTTGINTARIYNPVKQGLDQDPTGVFIRRWVPELDEVPDAFIHEPWKWPGAYQVLGDHYPTPIVDHIAAARRARERIWSIRKQEGFDTGAKRIQSRHGSRKSGLKHTGERSSRRDKTSRTVTGPQSRQLSLDLEDPNAS